MEGESVWHPTISADRNVALRGVELESGVDAWLVRPFSAEEFLTQVHALLRWKRRHDGMVERSADLRRVHDQLQNAYRELDQNLELARRIHQKLLVRRLPDVPPARFAVRSHACGRVSGDLYHVFRLGDDQVGFYLADVVGHGVSASLLTLFLKLAVAVNEVPGCARGLPPPHEILEGFNRALLDLAPADNPVVTMLYARFDCRSRSLSFARAGSPHPLYVPRIGEPTLCRGEGALLGVFDTAFTTNNLRLRSGDKVLLHTDGLGTPLSQDAKTGHARFLPVAHAAIPSSKGQKKTMSRSCDMPRSEPLQSLAGRYRALPIDEFVERLFVDLLQSSPSDDLTLLGLEVTD